MGRVRRNKEMVRQIQRQSYGRNVWNVHGYF